VSDDHRRLVNAIRPVSRWVTWQRCQTHFTKNIQAELKARLRTVFEAGDVETARQMAKAFTKNMQIWQNEL